MSRAEERVVGVPQLALGVVTIALFALVLLTPLLGCWVSSSLAAYLNGSARISAIAGLLLFPGLPLAWEAWAAYRRDDASLPRTSSFVDRLILRTLVINIVFLGGLLFCYPARSFVALSTRGDWFLDGRTGPAVEKLRSTLFAGARGLEWLYRAVHKNPYRDKLDDKKPVVHRPEPSAGHKPDASTRPSEQHALAWPLAGGLHPAVRSMPPDAEGSIEAVALYLRAHTRGTADRIRAMHDYVADRIAYDVDALKQPRIPDEAAQADTVFVRRLGVCAGYAHLLAALAAVTGDQIVYVVGDARDSSDPNVAGQPHAWNAAMVDGRWQLLDATWDAGVLKDGTFEKHYRTDYLFTPPEIFGLRHRPDADEWQLRPEPIDRGAFMRQPMLDPNFFSHGFRLVDPDRSQVTVAGAFDMHLRRSQDTFLMAKAKSTPPASEQSCTIDGTDPLHVRCELAPGKYDVVLFDSPVQFGTYYAIGSFDVNVTAP